LTKQILIVEDDEELQEYYTIMFEALDCRITHAFDGGQALEKLREVVPDLIILDILLDEMMGDAVFLYLKQDPRYAEIPIIIASVLPPESSAKLLGMDPRTTYLQKPFTRRELLQIVQDKCPACVGASA
jgi:twitching motility two-component system response regulator PilH